MKKAAATLFEAAGLAMSAPRPLADRLRPASLAEGIGPDHPPGRRGGGPGTLLFVGEIHRFNRSQQDAFLPHMEDGTIILVGATTENPSFELNSALLSRAGVLTFRRIDETALAAPLP